MFFFRSLAVMPPLPPALAKLAVLAKNFWWSWEPGADAVFRWLDEELWDNLHHNPVAFLLSLPPEKLAEAAQNPEYMEIYEECCARFEKYLNQPTWFDQTFPDQKERVIAYLSAEFGIHECLPIYSGGLGLLAGDHLKAASDLGLPLVAVGLLYKFGYFNQEINPEGWQEARYPLLNFYKMPITPVTDGEGRELEVQVELSGQNICRTVSLRIWEAAVGRVKLYLLDSDTPRNRVEDRQLTGRLYGGDQEMRLVQEILLGIGGVRALRAMGIKPVVWHINEGHAAFSVLERLRELVSEGLEIETAREVVRASTIFTTHTPVPAGHDIFQPELLSCYFERFCHQGNLNWNAFVAPAYDPDRQGYNMTLLAHRHASYTNAVSRLHGETTRRMFFHLYPGIPEAEIPVTTVTNGVHIETWVAPEWVERFNRVAGDKWRTSYNNPEAWEKIAKLPAAEIWSVRKELKARMLEKCRARLLAQRQRYFASPSQQEEIETYLPPDVLTVVFARRFATYKRAYLLLRDRERLARLVNDPEQPVQFIFAGKAHPADRSGQEIIKQIYDLSQEEPFRGKVTFVEEYDIELAQCLVQGADVWLNTPRRPLEASGTSGQKAVLNGTVHLSILDGWWPEAYNGKNGFAVGRGEVLPDDTTQDYYDSLSLYAVLEDVVIPAYYRRTHGVPRDWIEIIREGWRSIPHYFNTGRMVKEYAARFYVPLMERYDQLVKDDYAAARRVRDFKEYLTQNWPAVAVLSVTAARPALPVAGQTIAVAATVRLGAIKPEDVVVEIMLGRSKDWQLTEMNGVRMELTEALGDATYRFSGTITLTQGALGYTVRVRPADSMFVHPFELPLIAWAPEF
ncbi:alpha-glucan family phosphorylase [Thermodesulfitimonas autotrophica]|uniref:alpha-glucan family phosphorylase n=1 Tax=Thermodesulfitimonas autotrophica TaxID=1894989 RepID=UPI002FE0AB65